LTILVCASPILARTWYITADGTGDLPTIQAGIDTAAAGDTVLVAAGRYTWSNQGTGTEYGLILFFRNVTGFVVRSEAGPEATTLDAQRQGRVIYFMGENDITLEGFTITGGEAPEFGYYSGGGICLHVSYPLIKNCIISENSAQYGGGMWIGGVSAPTLEYCTFEGNEADHGGGVFIINTSTVPSFNRCVFDGNTAQHDGGGIFSYNGVFELEYCTVSRNSAGENGGGIGCEKTLPSTVNRCTISENTASAGGGIHLFWNSELTVRLSIIAWSGGGGALGLELDSALNIRCCDIYGNYGGDDLPPGTNDAGGNIYVSPQFCGIKGSTNYRLQSDSPCLPANYPGSTLCGIIGAHSMGCGSTDVKEDSWGGIKTMSKGK
jgi:predicted outer membrane repeat protein